MYVKGVRDKVEKARLDQDFSASKSARRQAAGRVTGARLMQEKHVAFPAGDQVSSNGLASSSVIINAAEAENEEAKKRRNRR